MFIRDQMSTAKSTACAGDIGGDQALSRLGDACVDGDNAGHKCRPALVLAGQVQQINTWPICVNRVNLSSFLQVS